MYHAGAQIDADINSRPTCTHGNVEHICECPVTDEWIRWYGKIVTEGGVLFDENYRVTGREEVVQYTWDVDEHRSPHNTAKELYQDTTLPYTEQNFLNIFVHESTFPVCSCTFLLKKLEGFLIFIGFILY